MLPPPPSLAEASGSLQPFTVSVIRDFRQLLQEGEGRGLPGALRWLIEGIAAR